MVTDINPGRGSSDAQQFRNLGGVLVFSADDGTHGLEPWRSDGTAAGTGLLEDVNPGRDTSYPWAPSTYDGSNRAIVIGDVMYFAANRAEVSSCGAPTARRSAPTLSARSRRAPKDRFPKGWSS